MFVFAMSTVINSSSYVSRTSYKSCLYWINYEMLLNEVVLLEHHELPWSELFIGDLSVVFAERSTAVVSKHYYQNQK